MSSALASGYYCEHGNYLLDLPGWEAPCGCSSEATPLCAGCFPHEPHSPYTCVMLVENEDGALRGCDCGVDSYAALKAAKR